MGNTAIRDKKNNVITSNIQRFLHGGQESVLIIVIVLSGFFMSMASEHFLGWRNFEAILLGLTVEATIAVGMAALLVSGGLDLSIGSTLALSGVITGLCLVNGVPVFLSVLVGLIVCLLIGAVNGILISKLNLNPFITTLGMMMILRGVVLVLAGGRAVINLPEAFLQIGQGELLGIQYPVYFLLILVVLGDSSLRNVRFFRQFYFIGSNEKAARLNGMNIPLIKITGYMIVSFLTGCAGIMLTARLGSASVTVGQGVEMRVITAAIIGGASLNGGKGTILGAFLGALFLGILSNALNLLGVDIYWQNLITGVTLVLAIVIDSLSEMKKKT